MMSSFKPRLGLKTYSSASLQPSLYFPRSRSATAIRGGPFPVAGNFSYGDGNNSAVGSLPDGEPTVRVTVGAADVDDVSGRLWLAGAIAIAEAPAGAGVELIAGFA